MNSKTNNHQGNAQTFTTWLGASISEKLRGQAGFALMAAVWLPLASSAGNLFWDANGAAAGAGGATPAGTWGTDSFWSNDSTGAAATFGWNPGDVAIFSASNNATGIFTVNVNGTQSAAGLSVEEGSLTLAGGVVSLGAAASVSVSASQNLTVSSVISGSTLSKIGGGSLSLNGVNTYTGPLTITGNAVRFNNNGAAGFGAIIVSPVSAVFLQTSSGGVTLTNPITLNNGQSVDISAQTGSFTLNGDISGGRSLWSVGGQSANTVVFGGNNTFTGNVEVNAGTLIVTHDNALGTVGGTTKVASGATLGFQGTFDYNTAEVVKLFGDGVSSLGAIKNISGDNKFFGPIDLQSSVTLGAVSGDLDLGGTISGGAFNVTKVGAGRIIISGLGNNFAATTVNAGTLEVNSTLGSGAVSVSLGATLAGNGVIVGPVTLSGEMSPASSPGTLTTGSESWNPNASYLWEINEADFGMAGDSIGWDLVDIGGTLTINATSLNPFVVRLSSLDPFGNAPGAAGSFDNTADYVFPIAQTTGGISGFHTNKFSINTSGFSNNTGVGIFILELANANNDLVLKFVHPAFITSQPVSATRECGVNGATFIVGTGGSGVLSYQWSSNGVPLVDDGRILGATAATLSITPVHLADSANYSCLISNIYGSTNSAAAVLTVNDTLPPVITCPIAVLTVANPGVCFATGVSLGSPMVAEACDAFSVVTNNAAALYPSGYPVGSNPVTWGATDGSGNHSECVQMVIVTDTQLPLVAANAISRQLDNAGDYTLNAADIAAITAGSSDNCGIASTNLNPTVFNFCDVGANNVTVTLTDIHGNVSNRVAVVTITAPPTPTVVYVDDDYPATCAAVNFPSNGLPGPYYVGFNAFNTIQAGIDAVAIGGTVNVAAGLYAEDLDVDKSVSLIGPNANINPNTGSRVAEAVVVPATSDPDPFSIFSRAIAYLSTSGITINGFTIDGDNAALTSGVVLRGADVDAIEAIAGYEGVGSIAISNNIIKNTSYTGLDFYNFYNGGSATTDNRIRDNQLTNIGHISYGYGIGILIYNNFYAEISGNVLTEVRLGVQTGNFYQNNPGTTASISDNTISSSKKGIFYNLHYSAASTFVISNNIISVEDEVGATRWDGIMLSSQQSSVGVTVISNSITATPVTQTTVGYQLWNDPTTLGMTITGGSVAGANYGVWLNNYDGYGPSDGDSTTLTLSGVTITNASLAGVYVKDNPLNSNGATVHAALNGNTVIGSTVGLLVDGPDASLDPGNTALSNLSGDYIDLVNASSGNMDATSVLFDGLTGAGMSLAQLFATEDRIDHATDTAGLGFVRVKAANVYVTQNSGSIQRGINPATSGDTVNVNDGTYTESLTINKSLLVKSASGFGVTTIGGTSQTAVTIAADYVTLLGFTVTNPGGKWGIYSPNRNHVVIAENRLAEIGNTDATPSVSNFGIAIESSSAGVDDIQIVNNVVSNLFGGSFKSAQAIAVGFSGGSFDITGLVIRSNLIAQVTSSTNAFGAGGRGAYGIILNHTTSSAGKTIAAQITENEITDLKGLWAHGIGLEGNTPGAVVQSNIVARLIDFKSPGNPDAVGVMVEDNTSAATVIIGLNSFTNVWFGVRNVTAFPVKAESNWWGSASGPAAVLNPGGLGVAASANVDFSPWLGDGTDSSPGIGFQPNLAPAYAQPDHLVFFAQPGNAALNALLSTQPVVGVIDENGGLATQFNGSVTVVIGSNPGGGVLAGTLTVPVVAGIATFTDLSITVGGGAGFTLVASTASPVLPATSATFDIGNPVPSITSLNPFWKPAGDPTFTLTVTGSDFVPTSEVLWNGSPRVTTYLNATTVTASIPAADILAVGIASVSVSNPPTAGGVSGSLPFRIESTPPAVVYVDDDYANNAPDDLVNFPDNGGIGTHIIGYDAFATIQGGVNAVTNTGTVHVAAGNFPESVVVNKAVTMLGANQGLAGCDLGRGPVSLIAGGLVALDITADGVSVDGFDITGATGVRDLGHESVIVRNNAITAAAVGVDLEGVALTAVAGVTASNNCIVLTSQLVLGTPTIGVTVLGVSGTASPAIENNNISGGFFGYLLYDASASVSTIIKGGTVTGVRQGLAVVNYAPPTLPTLKPSTFTADGISMSGFAGATTHAGVYVFTGGSDASANVTGLIKNLLVTGTGKPVQDSAGVVLADFSTAVGNRQNIAIEDCTITNNLNRGVSIRGSNCVATVTRSIVDNNGGDPFGAGGNDGFGIIVRNGSQVTVTECFVTNPSAQAGIFGVHALAADASTAPEGPSLTVTNSAINNSGNALGNLAVQSAGTLNGSGNHWGMTSETAISALITGTVDFTPYLDSGVDTSVTIGFQGDFTTVHVTTLGAQTGIATRIQEGVDMVSGSTVLVEAGSYPENVSITKKVVIDGTGSGNGAGDSIVTAANPALPVFLVTDAGGTGAGDRLTIKDLRVTGGSDGIRVDAATGTRQWYRIENVVAVNNTGSGVALAGVATLGQVQVTGSVLSNNGLFGLQVADTLASFAALAVSGGGMDDNGAVGLGVYGLDGNLTSPTQISVTGTTFANNGSPADAGAGDLSFFRFNGNAALTNVTVTADAQYPIQFRGKGTASPASWNPLGTVRLENVTVSGATARPGLYIIRYSDVANVSFENVDLSGLVPPLLPSGFASLMQVQHTGVTPLNLHGLILKATYVGGPPVGYGALAMLQSGGAVADCSTVILGAATVQELENSVYDLQDNAFVGDVVFPVLSLTPAAPNVIAECTGGGQATVTFASPSVTADCPPVGAVVCVPASGSIFALGTNTVICTVTDNRGISASTNFAVIVLDTTSPDIVSCAPSSNVVANASCQGITPDLTSLVAATDGCGSGVLVVTQSPLAGSLINLGANLVTLTVTDPSGNFSNCVATVTVVDQTAPSVTFWPTNRTLSVGAGCTLVIPDLTVEVLATDSCSPPIIVTQNPLAGTSAGLGLTAVTVTVADQVGNATNYNTLLTIVDTSNPAITCPAGVTVNRLSPTDPYATGFATASDNCTNVTITYNDNRSGLTNCNATGDILRTWTATDGASNATACVQTITIFDTVVPLFTSAQTNIITTNDLGNCSAVVTFPMLTAVDVGYDQGFENPAWVSGSYLTLPSVDWNDYSSPIARVTSGTDGIVSKTGGAHAVINSTALPASPDDYTGAFNRMGGYSSVFGSGFRSSVDVYLDLSNPAVTANTYGWDVSTAVNDQSGGHRRDFVFHTASDVGGNILVAASNNSGGTRRNDLASINHYTVTASGWYTLEWVFRDNGSGVLAVDCNLRDASGTLLWTETRSDVSDLISTAVGGNRYMWFTFLEVNKLAIDNAYLERNAPVVCTPASASAFAVGTNTVTCVASDACGNTATNTFTITVIDVQNPTITCPTDITQNADFGQCSATVILGTPTTADNCAVGLVTNNAVSQTSFPVGTNLVTWTVTDIHGNSATCQQTVIVLDNQLPQFACPGAFTNNADFGQCSATFVLPPLVATDNCGVTAVSSNAPANFPVGVTPVTWSAVDIHGNTNTCVQLVTVLDTQLPQVAAGSIAACYETSPQAEAAAIAATSATDNCGVASTNILSTAGTCSAVITVRVTDIHGNFADVTYNTRIDPTAPVIGLTTASEVQTGGPVNVKNNDCLTNAVVQGTVLISVEASDNCSLVGGHPSVTLVNGINNEAATFLSQSGITNYYSWVVTSATANGTWTATVSASDICHNTTTNFTLCVNKTQVTGLVQLEGFVGTGTNVNHTRLVTFVATGGATNKTWNLTLTNVSGDTFSYALTDVPAGSTGISAVTAWNLREKLTVALDINGQATADFIADGIFGWSGATDHYLRGGEFTGDNQIQFFDYTVLGNNFFTFNAVADITGDGQVDYDDYFILYLNWFTAGDPQ